MVSPLLSLKIWIIYSPEASCDFRIGLERMDLELPVINVLDKPYQVDSWGVSSGRRGVSEQMRLLPSGKVKALCAKAFWQPSKSDTKVKFSRDCEF